MLKAKLTQKRAANAQISTAMSTVARRQRIMKHDLKSGGE